MKERKHSEEIRAKISAGKKGKLHPMFGKLHSDEACLKLSKQRLGKPRLIKKIYIFFL